MRFISIIITILFLANYLFSKPLIVICIDSFSSQELSKCNYLQNLALDGVSSPGLEPVFPVKSFPNLLTISTGLFPENHGIIANHFKDYHLVQSFSIEDTNTTKDPDWYYGRTIWGWAKQHGKITAGFNWPATNLESYKKSADISVYGEDSVASDFTLSMLSGETFSKADLILIYLKNDGLFNYKINSDNYNNILKNYENIIKNIFNNLENNNIYNFNYLIISNGGLKDIDDGELISIENELNSSKKLIIQNYGSFMIIDGNENEIVNITGKLGLRSGISTYLKPNYPDNLHFNNSPLTGKALIIADSGNLIINKSIDQSNLPIKNANGYLPTNLAMHGIFIAGGPDVKRLKTGTIKSIDVFALMCELLELPIPNNIDSKPERINFILK